MSVPKQHRATRLPFLMTSWTFFSANAVASLCVTQPCGHDAHISKKTCLKMGQYGNRQAVILLWILKIVYICHKICDNTFDSMTSVLIT